jgi:hypothetical protein
LNLDTGESIQNSGVINLPKRKRENDFHDTQKKFLGIFLTLKIL